MGFTSSGTIFYVRDNGQAGGYGLQPSTWTLYFATCAGAGLMNGAAGMVFFRMK